MVKDIGLITRTFPGRCIDYFIWVQRLQQELQYKMFAVPGATFEVGQWVQCTITEGACGYFKIETIRRTKKTHAAAALHVDRVLTIPSAKEDPLVAQNCQAQNEEIDGAFEHLSLTPEPPNQDTCKSAAAINPPYQDAPTADQAPKEVQFQEEDDSSDEDVLSEPGERHANDAEDIEIFEVEDSDDE
ncbi:hypothetical protein L596_001068 [Steinernema carpocapsae]|uniref:Uncharacterized protein n=1 Tax=Steinernema carpocapsae TaxID=34508 RepID=A0A4U8UL74_STECR|nr:hypothetical protein L596_001068 [Steinernema carpocapsae]